MRENTSTILAQKLLRSLAPPAPRRIIAFLILPFLGVVAAFGIAPDTATDTVTRKQVIEQLALPPASIVLSPDAGFWREERARRDDTLGTLLARLGVDDPEAVKYLRGERAAKGLYRLVPGRTMRAQTTAEGRLIALRYTNGSTLTSVDRSRETFTVIETPVELERRVQMGSGHIRSSLFAATDAANLPDAIAIQIADIFSTDIDFHRDLRRGDRFTVVYETFHDQGEWLRTGRVLAAEFVNNYKVYQTVWFQYGDNEGGY
jgi:hypothetical protein